MSTKWKTGGYGKDLIVAVECVSETAKQLTLRFKSGGFASKGEFFERRVAKSSAYDCYFDSWQEAKDHLMAKAERELFAARAALQRKQDELGNIKGLKAPQEQQP